MQRKDFYLEKSPYFTLMGYGVSIVRQTENDDNKYRKQIWFCAHKGHS